MNSIVDIIRVPFGYLLEWLYTFTGSYGLALLLFSLVVKLILVPLSAKSKKTMMKTSRLQPKLKQIELACGDDKQKYQQEVQQLYKDEGVSMMGGCLWSFIPLLLLLPLYTVIREPLQYLLHLDTGVVEQLKTAFEATGAKADTYWQLRCAADLETFGAGIVNGVRSLNFDFLGIDLAQTPWTLVGELGFTTYVKTVFTDWSTAGGVLLALISGGLNYLTVFISQKMNNSVIADDNGEKDAAAAATAQTGKLMTTMMPLLSVVFGFVMPLGLSVYWIAQSVFGIVQDYFLTKHYRKVYDAEDAVKREKAAELAAEEAEKERIRALKRAANPDGITENTSKKKQQLRERQGREAAAKEFEAKKRAANGEEPQEPAKNPGGEANRPYARGRAYEADRYQQDE